MLRAMFTHLRLGQIFAHSTLIENSHHPLESCMYHLNQTYKLAQEFIWPRQTILVSRRPVHSLFHLLESRILREGVERREDDFSLPTFSARRRPALCANHSLPPCRSRFEHVLLFPFAPPVPNFSRRSAVPQHGCRLQHDSRAYN